MQKRVSALRDLRRLLSRSEFLQLKLSSSIEGIEKWPYEAAAVAFEAIPRTLAQNCGVNVIRTMTALQGKHANGENAWMGIDGNTGAITDMKERKLLEAAWCLTNIAAGKPEETKALLPALPLLIAHLGGL
ncbi:hypothetical protein AAG906_007428 [Vitis piasezkii]